MESSREKFMVADSEQEMCLTVKSNATRSTHGHPLSRLLMCYECSDRNMAIFNLLFGVLAVLSQLASLCSTHWFYTIEPRVAEGTDDRGEPKEALFIYNAGYWWICREPYGSAMENSSLIGPIESGDNTPDSQYQRSCLFTQRWGSSDDLVNFSLAAGDIINGMQLAVSLHVVSLCLTMLSLLLSLFGYLRKDIRTLIASVIYILSGIIISLSVLQFICVLEDEMNTRVKATPEGEPSKYRSYYGWSFVLASCSFIFTQVCALVEVLIYLRRYSSVEEKLVLVPGLQKRVNKLILQKEFLSKEKNKLSFVYGIRSSFEN